MRIYSIILCLVLFPIRASCLDTAKVVNNALFVEIGGNTTFYSINFERVRIRSVSRWQAVRGGVEIWPRFNGRTASAALTVEGLLIRGPKDHHLEMGMGFTSYYVSYKDEQRSLVYFYHMTFNALIRLGYRFQKPGDRIFFKAGLILYAGRFVYLGSSDPDVILINDEGHSFIGLWGGVAVGWTFKK